MSPTSRRRVHRVIDPLLAPIGSVAGPRSVHAPVVGLTFDDGPDPSTTPAVLASLEAAAVRATFFMLGDRAARHPEVVREVVEAGHEVALHGLDHRRLTTLSPRDTYRALTRGRAILEDVAGVAVRWYRPPYGAQNVGNYLAARRAGLHPVVWTAEGHDWEAETSDVVIARLSPALCPGALLLLHDALAGDPRGTQPPDPLRSSRGALVAALLEVLAEQRLTVTTVGDLVADGARRTAWFRP